MTAHITAHSTAPGRAWACLGAGGSMVDGAGGSMVDGEGGSMVDGEGGRYSGAGRARRPPVSRSHVSVYPVEP